MKNKEKDPMLNDLNLYDIEIEVSTKDHYAVHQFMMWLPKIDEGLIHQKALPKIVDKLNSLGNDSSDLSMIVSSVLTHVPITIASNTRNQGFYRHSEILQ